MFAWLAVVVPGLIAFGLSCIDLAGRSIWLDESATLSIASQQGSSLWHAIARDGGNMSGYYVLLHLLISAFGDGLMVLRLPSAIATGFTVALGALIALRLFNRVVAAVAGTLGAVSLPLVYWGQDARGYALMAMFVTASFLCLVELDERSTTNRPSLWAWTAYFLTTAIAVYMSYVALLAVVAQVVWIVLCRRPWKKAASALGIAVVLCAPLAFLAVNRGTGQLDWLTRPGFAALSVVVATVASASQQPNIHQTSTSDFLEALTWAMAVVGLVMALRHRGAAPARASVLLLASWITIPVIAAFVESYVAQPVFLSRNLLMCVLPVGILASLVLAEPGMPRSLGFGALVVMAGLRLAQIVPSYGESSENWRAATAFVLAGARSGDCVAFYPSDGRQAFDYYVLHSKGALRVAPSPILPPLPLRDVRPYVEVYATISGQQIASKARACRRLWLVSSHTGTLSGTRSSRAHYRTFQQLLAGLSRHFVAVRTAHFGWAYPVRVELYGSASLVDYGRKA